MSNSWNAWGKSWGNSWGSSWGATASAPIALLYDGGNRNRKKRALTYSEWLYGSVQQDDEELLMIIPELIKCLNSQL